jgi:hypothetical protein
MSSNERVAPRVDTPARRQLVAWMAENPKRRSRGFIARSLGVSQPAVSAWITGISRPAEELRPALQLLAGIDPNLWRTDDERGREIRALRLAARAQADDSEPPESADDEPRALTGTDNF